MGVGGGTVSDYIVVGAGSAGSVITRRLLDAGHSVHVIEAGPVDSDPAIHSPQGWPGLLGGPLDWGFVTTRSRHAYDRRLFWPRGKVLGGTSSVNGMIYIRGHPSDYDRWAYATGRPNVGVGERAAAVQTVRSPRAGRRRASRRIRSATGLDHYDATPLVSSFC